VTIDAVEEHDVLVLAKIVGSTRFPVEQTALVGVDRASGRLLRVVPFAFGARDTEPPIAKWTWLQMRLRSAERDPRPESVSPEGDIAAVGYVEARDGWKLRWPFVRPHLRGSLEELTELSRAGVASAGYVRPARGAAVAMDSMSLRMRCDSQECRDEHTLPILDWEVRETSRSLHEREPLAWRTRAEAMWGAGFFERYDVHVLVSAFAQAPSRFFVAGLFYPPRAAETAAEHAAHAHRVG
jgi:hypothetical protein